MFEVDESVVNRLGDKDVFDEDQIETIDAVLDFYGDKASYWLSELTHAEDPWKLARGNLGPSDRCKKEITHASMAEYYESLY